MTIILKINDDKIKDAIHKAAVILQRGGLVVFPTETVYGLGANAFDPCAVKKIFEVKGRPVDNPLIVHISNNDMLKDVVDFSRLTSKQMTSLKKLTKQFWPGPLTLILPKNKKIPYEVTAGLDTVAVRMPSHPIAFSLIEEAGIPVAAPSANRSGLPSPTSFEDVYEDLNGLVDCIIDGGSTDIGLESTVLLLNDPPVVLRPGRITPEELSRVLNQPVSVSVTTEKDNRPLSPGMKYRHYSPRAKVILVCPCPEISQRLFNIWERVRQEDEEDNPGKPVKLVVMVTRRETYNQLSNKIHPLILLGDTLEEVAHNLFGSLRWADRRGYTVIIIEGVEENGLGIAIMNRLRRAASQIIHPTDND